LPSIGFMRPFGFPVTILNTLDPLGKFQGKVDEGFLVGYSVCSKAFRVFNSRTRIVKETLHKSVSPDIYSTSIGAQKRKQSDKTENKDKGKSHVVAITGFRDLNAKFEEYYNNNSNGVNATSSSVCTAGKNSIDSTNDFSATGPSNAVMPNLEDLSHDADDVDSTNDFSATGPSNAVMPNLEDLSRDADDVGTEADINNLESII
nr:retrovirus-related Pol polyprotein from transposon TNT 1-94 [Tanacetum cinerariifolium]